MKRKSTINESLIDLEKRLGENLMIRLSIEKKNICLTKHEEKWIAFEEACPHLGVSLAGGMITPFEEIVCPWHGFRFNIFDGREAEERCRHLNIYEVIVEENRVVILT